MHLARKSCKKCLNAKVISLLQQSKAVLILKKMFSSLLACLFNKYLLCIFLGSTMCHWLKKPQVSTMLSFAPRRLKSIGIGKHLIIIEETANYSLQVDYIYTLRSVPCYVIPHPSSS